MILIDGYLYGGTEDQNIVYCAELKTGEVQWKKRGSGSKSIAVAAADGRLYLRFQNGLMVLAKASPDEFEEISSFQAPGSGDSLKPSWAHPVISDGRLYLREGDAILCYKIAGE